MEKKILDFNGSIVANSEDLWSDNVWSLLSVQEGGYLILRGGNFVAKKDDCYAIDVRDGGHLIIESGKYNGNVTSVYVHDGVLEVRGGEFDIQQLSPNGDKRFMLNCLDKNYQNGTAKIIVSGGKFHGFDPGNNLAEGPDTNFLAPGYASVEKDGWFEVVPVDQVEE